MLQDSYISTQAINIEPPLLVDEASSTLYYIGVSINNKDTGKAYWRIKKIEKIGNVWTFQYPDGNQDYVFVWDDRYGYDYSA